MSDPQQQRAVDLAVQAFANAHHVAVSAVVVDGVVKEQIPNPPPGPGQVTTNPVRYRYYVRLRSGTVSERYRVEGRQVSRA